MYKISRTQEYQEWLEEETLKSQTQIEKRLSNIEIEGHFGDHKPVGDEIWELRWENGRRVYYAYLTKFNVIILLGGNKNGQSKDITQAKRIFKKNIEVKKR